MKRIAVVVHEEKPHAADAARVLAAACLRRGVETITVDGDTVPEDVEAVIGVGGDGTVLRAGRLALESEIPIAGINVGRVGYLAEFAVDEIDAFAGALALEELRVFSVMTVSVEGPGFTATGLNDVVIEKVVTERIIEIAVAINGRRFAEYRTDGMIIATPLGSTAYSLSAGGPVVDPEVEALVLTPIAPHSLLSRSIVVSPDAEIGVTVEIDRPARVNVDGREIGTVEPGASVVVSRGSRAARFMTLDTHPFPQAVRHQFGLAHA
ncbi:MAG: NAD(+)/NADH kinase [Actinomycetota bacterium]|nr:NAD(+)/NADH kinase [Actinomycetota bacterium]